MRAWGFGLGYMGVTRQDANVTPSGCMCLCLGGLLVAKGVGPEDVVVPSAASFGFTKPSLVVSLVFLLQLPLVCIQGSPFSLYPMAQTTFNRCRESTVP